MERLTLLLVIGIAFPISMVAIAVWQSRLRARARDNSPEARGFLVYDDFLTPDAVAAALNHAPAQSRRSLTIWQYALLRSQAHGLPRPVSVDIAFLQRRVLLVRPALATFRIIMSSAVALMGATSVVYAARAGDVGVALLFCFIGIIGGAAVVSTVRAVRSNSGRAMRLLWDAADVDPVARLAMLEEAIRLDPEQGRAQTHGGG